MASRLTNCITTQQKGHCMVLYECTRQSNLYLSLNLVC